MTYYLGLLLLAAALALSTWLVLGVGFSGDRLVRMNLRMGFKATKDEELRNGPDFGWARNLTTAKGAERLNTLWAKAGRPAKWPIARVMAYKPTLAVVATAVMLVPLITSGFDRMFVLTAMVVVPVAYFVPDLLLYNAGQDRQKAIALELADTLDQMMIAVDAGLGFESAMARAAANGKGPFAGELNRTLQEMRVGIPRRDAYKAMEARTNVPDLRNFTQAVIQADAYGISISDVLRTQADEMRVKRKQRAEETAQKIPVKILIPLVLFVMPVMFLVIIGPMVIDIFLTS